MELSDLLSMNLADVLNRAEARASVKTYMEFFTGQPCRTCQSAISGYFYQMKFKSEYYIRMETEIKTRTCKPAWDGLLYFKGNHHRSDIITDAQTTDYLERGLLLPEHFAVLPEKKKYIKTKRTDVVPDETKATDETEAPE